MLEVPNQFDDGISTTSSIILCSVLQLVNFSCKNKWKIRVGSCYLCLIFNGNFIMLMFTDILLRHVPKLIHVLVPSKHHNFVHCRNERMH